MLQRIELEAKRGKEYYGIHKVIFRDSTLFIAGDPGLFIGKSQSHLLNPVKDTKVNNIILDCDTVYALLENAVVRVDDPCDATDSVYKTIASGKFYSYSKTPGNEEWLLSERAVFLRKYGMTYG